ncbi:probable ubiquitin-like-specific protease 2A isoform X2 [Manihot esculenta]|uniref:probable ubiquitin-like-specific protease 2A isoform X2 n=1 Tax=Manihot esculenta TaxID=3983 RepID=UPI001CC41E79|nr:probable ubiquitin-like-specific protease 2A isoform X2 [Manihot esculenta]
MTRPPPSWRVSSAKRLSVLDFSEDDDRVEKDSSKFLGKFAKPKRKRNFTSPITKYKFLEYFAGCTRVQEKESAIQHIVVDDESVDIDMGRCPGAQEKENANEPIIIDNEPVDGDMGFAGGIRAPHKEIRDESVDIDVNDVSHPLKLSLSPPICILQEDCIVKEASRLDAMMLSGSPNYENKSVHMISDDDDGSEISSASISISALKETEVPLKDPVPESSSVGHKIDILNNAVVVFPDVILYEDIYCTDSRLTFSRSYIRVEGSIVNGAKGTFNVEWAISDIISIESEWCQRVETAIINLLFKRNVFKGAGNANETSAIDKLTFSVYDPCWFEGQQAIKSLDVRYRSIWNVIFEEKVDDAFSMSNSMAIAKPCLNVLDEPFENIIYPKGDPDAVSISKRDVELLRPETFINDTIIDFYIKFLKNKIQPEDQHQFHFFNSFFFRKLVDLDKDPRNSCEGRQAFQCVHKWTRNVDLFEKDYIFIPVNYSLHWSLIVICHPGEVANFRGKMMNLEGLLKYHASCTWILLEEVTGASRILFKVTYVKSGKRGIVTLWIMYLQISHFYRLSHLSCPQQENSFDCGLFLLHYVELFLEEVPINFSPFKITEFSNFFNRNWFLPEEASLKRAHIRKLICEIIEDQSQQLPKGESVDKYPCSHFASTNEEETGVEFLTVEYSSLKMCEGHPSSPNTELGNEITLTSASSLSVVPQKLKEPGLESREFEPETSARLFYSRNCSRACHQSFTSPVEKAEEIGEQISDSLSDAKKSWKQNYMQVEELYDVNSSSITSVSESQKSSEIGLDDHDSGNIRETAGQESSSTSTENLSAYIVEDSQEAKGLHTGNDATSSDEELKGNRENISPGKIM